MRRVSMRKQDEESVNQKTGYYKENVNEKDNESKEDRRRTMTG